MKKFSLIKMAARALVVLMLAWSVIEGVSLPGGPGAVSAFDGSVSAGISAIEPGDHIYVGKRNASGFTGLPYWRVLDKDADGSLYLMSEYLWTGSNEEDFLQFNEIADVGVPMEGYEQEGYLSKGSAWQGSMAQAWCRRFESAVLADVSGMTIKPVTKTDDEFQSPDDKDVAFAWTRDILNGDKVFFLSGEEAVRYMPTKGDRIAYLHDGNSVGDHCDYWLRSPRLYTFSECAGKVLGYGDHGGEVARQVVSSSSAARPVFWASFTEDVRAFRCVHDGEVTWTIDPEGDAQGCSDLKYKWADGNKRCTASAVCNICLQTVTESVRTTSKVTRPAKVLQDGTREFTAEFSNDLFTTQTKQVRIPRTYDPVKGAPDSKLPKLSVKKAKGAKKAVSVSWKKLSSGKRKKVSGIEVQYGTDSKFKKKAVIKTCGKTKTSITIKKLRSKKNYWVRVRTYKKRSGIKYVSGWSKAKKIRTR